jgi:O-succinylhomoserine sulfhydrylase
MRVLTGPSLDPHASWLLLRGLQTLPLRVRAQSETAGAVARRLEASPAVSHLRYPFLPSHPGHAVAQRQMAQGGGMVSFAFTGGLESTRRFVRALRWIPLASSLGSVYTTLEVPEELDFATEEIGDRTESFAMPSGLVRLSIGVESMADVERDIQRGLDAVLEGLGSAPRTPAS